MRLAWEAAGRGQWSFTGGIGLAGAVDPLDLDANGFRDGEQSSRPNLQSRAGYSHPSWVAGQPLSIGASVYRGWLRVSRPAGTGGVGEFFGNPDPMRTTYEKIKGSAGRREIPPNWQVLIHMRMRDGIAVNARYVTHWVPEEVR